MVYLKVNNIKLNINKSNDDAIALAIKTARVVNVHNAYIAKKSIDARKKPDLKYIYSVIIEADSFNSKDKSITVLKQKPEYKYSITGSEISPYRPVIIGFGPAGMFLAYLLSINGFKPIVIERGSMVDKRTKDVESFWNGEELNLESNVQFGEGGAGTFSDGKLNTGNKDKLYRISYVLDTFVKHGAMENIKYDAKPHVGTDVLKNVISSMREFIIAKGGEFHFDTKFTGTKQCDDGVIVNTNKGDFKTNFCCLCIGNSSRDTFEMLNKDGFDLSLKPFAVGLRVEHKQSLINLDRYGFSDNRLGAAPYKLTFNSSSGRSVFSFCMCPGGYVVNASSEESKLAVNGMSYSKRDGENANSAVVVSVTPDDFDVDDVLSGMTFQRDIEHKAYIEGKGLIPVQKYIDFKNNIATTELGSITPNLKGDYSLANLRNVLPDFLQEAFVEAMEYFGKVIKGFNNDDVILSGIESRTSSPLRIERNDKFMTNHPYIYAAGEGAGYAGGIVSSAVDGIKVFEHYISLYSSLNNDF